MGWPDRMGALTDRTRRASFGRRTRLLSPAPDYAEFAHRNKRSRQQQEESPFHFPSSIADSSLCWSESKAKTKPKFELPPPSPLKRPVQGPHRPTDFQKTRVSTLSVPDKQLEQEWMMEERCYHTSNLESLESYKKRFAALQTKFAYTNGNHHGVDCAGIAIQDEGLAIDSVRGGITIEDERVDVATYSRGIETEGEGIAIASGHPSSTPVDVVDVEMNSGRESESDCETEDGKPPEEGEPLYKRLKEKAAYRDFKLKAIEMEIKIAEAKFEALKITKPKNKKDENESKQELEALHSTKARNKKVENESKQIALRDALAPLEDKAEDDVAHALEGRKRREVLVMHKSSNIEITRQTLQCLMPGAWLNDEVINLYFELLKEREKRDPRKFLKCHFFNTFFYKKLYNKRNYDYKAVRRWTTHRKIGYNLIDCDKIFVPIHKEIHWCLAIIDIKAKKFQYLDSLKGTDACVLEVLAKYIVDEAKDKSDKDLDVSDWDQEFVEDLPGQENGWDCGVFMIKYADFHSQDLPLSFSQANMPYFRKRTAKEILGLRAE